jgi:hypothetical protein
MICKEYSNYNSIDLCWLHTENVDWVIYPPKSEKNADTTEHTLVVPNLSSGFASYSPRSRTMPKMNNKAHK